MSSWLQPVEDALDAAPAPVPVFFRDDDAGWGDERLLALLDAFAERELPVDLAVIPRELDAGLARELRARPVGLHQHGLAHVNHEREGRKCEFGPARDAAAQRRDIAEGRERLTGLLGDRVDPIFTPPWNRCTTDTGRVLAELGFSRAVARGARGAARRAGPARAAGERRWFAQLGARLSPEELGTRIAAAIGGGVTGRADVPPRGHGRRGHAAGGRPAGAARRPRASAHRADDGAGRLSRRLSRSRTSPIPEESDSEEPLPDGARARRSPSRTIDPDEPEPEEPRLREPEPDEPEPEEPLPDEPEPEEPEPDEPEPEEPLPDEPEPDEPEPEEPEPDEPEPDEPDPDEPEPDEPEPDEPLPDEPEPGRARARRARARRARAGRARAGRSPTSPSRTSPSPTSPDEPLPDDPLPLPDDPFARDDPFRAEPPLDEPTTAGAGTLGGRLARRRPLGRLARLRHRRLVGLVLRRPPPRPRPPHRPRRPRRRPSRARLRCSPRRRPRRAGGSEAAGSAAGPQPPRARSGARGARAGGSSPALIPRSVAIRSWLSPSSAWRTITCRCFGGSLLTAPTTRWNRSRACTTSSGRRTPSRLSGSSSRFDCGSRATFSAAFRATRYSHGRSAAGACPASLDSARYALMNVCCTASSAADPGRNPRQ